MSRQKKKRTKRYQGTDAKVTAPTVMRVSAEERSPFKEWWLAYGRITKVIGAVVGVITVLIVLVIGVIGLIF